MIINIVWIDLEMTGLKPHKDHILEIATVVTDPDLNIIEKGPEIIIRNDVLVLEEMSEWCRETHKESGLWDNVLNSTISLELAETMTMAFLKTLTEVGENPMAGNSIWRDRWFLATHMPKIDNHLGYRMIDVSGIKELVSRWYPYLNTPPKKKCHRAMDDILESIEELKFYKNNIF